MSARCCSNGQPLTRSFIRHDEIMAGGELRFEMQVRDRTWAASAGARPYSMSKDQR